MTSNISKIKYLLVAACLIVFMGSVNYASNVGNGFVPNYGPNYNYYPNFNPYYNGYYPNNMYDNFGYNPAYVIPDNSYYYIAGYDRDTTYYCNGLAMISRVPIIGGNNYYPTRVANGIIYNAYVSISNWCNEHILRKDGIQDYYLNYATIVNQTVSSIILNVNCSYKKAGIINGYTEFRITADISRNKFTWRRLGVESSSENIDDSDEYEIYDSDSGQVIIIR